MRNLTGCFRDSDHSCVGLLQPIGQLQFPCSGNCRQPTGCQLCVQLHGDTGMVCGSARLEFLCIKDLDGKEILPVCHLLDVGIIFHFSWQHNKENLWTFDYHVNKCETRYTSGMDIPLPSPALTGAM